MSKKTPKEAPPERPTPHSLDAEKSVLGALLLNPMAWAVVSGVIKPDDFFRQAHRLIFEAMVELRAVGTAIDLITLKEQLSMRGVLEEVGGPAYVAKMTDGVPRTTNVQHYAAIVGDKARARRGIEFAEWLAEEFRLGERSSSIIVDEAARRLLSMVERVSAEEGRAADEIRLHAERLIKGEAVPALPTGYTKLDKLIVGLRKKDFALVAARPSVGKTSFVLGIADYLAQLGYVVLVATLEMSKQKLASRMLGWRSGVSERHVEKGLATDADYTRIFDVCTNIADIPLLLSENARTLTQQQSWVQRVKAEVGRVDVVICDYVQLMVAERGYSSRESEVSSLSRGVKQLAKDEDVAYIGLSQLKRPQEGKADKRPQMSDLRESGALEQDADLIMLLYRAEMHDAANPENRGTAEAIVSKNRDGPIGTVRLYFSSDLAQFADLDE
jgi:replicative DNA helicase